jgi:hypothetical protein
VRLDHLLSKEHLPAKAGQEPVPPECGGGVLDGGDTGESRPTAATGLEYSRPLGGGGGKEGVVRLVVAWTPCWVLKEQPRSVWPVGVGSSGSAIHGWLQDGSGFGVLL